MMYRNLIQIGCNVAMLGLIIGRAYLTVRNEGGRIVGKGLQIIVNDGECWVLSKLISDTEVNQELRISYAFSVRVHTILSSSHVLN